MVAEFIHISWQMAFAPLYIALLTFCIIVGLCIFNLRKHFIRLALLPDANWMICTLQGQTNRN